MEEGDYFAIETFGSTGRGEVHDEGECSHYALMKDAPRRNLTLASAKRLLNTINREFGTLPFARRYVDRVGETNYLLGVSTIHIRVLNGVPLSQNGEYLLTHLDYNSCESSSRKGSYKRILLYATSKAQ